MARSRSTDTPSPAGTGPGRGKGSTGATAVGRDGKAKAPTGKNTSKGRTKGKDGAPKVGRLTKVKNQVRTIRQAYTLTKKNDPRLPWVMLIAFVAVFAVVEIVAILFDSPFLFLPIALLLGRPGIVLVGEGSPQRVRGLVAQEKRRIAKVVGDTPIYDVLVGDDEGQVPLKKLSAHVMKLPRNLDGGEVNALGKRMAALGGARMPVPGGPLPGGRQMSVSQRQMRRR